MTATMESNALSLTGYPVFDADGSELGQVAGVYLDRQTGEPEWAALQLSDGRITVVPLADAGLYEDSVDLPFGEQQVRAAPYQQDEIAPELSPDQETELYRYYGQDGIQGAAREAATEVASTAKEQGREVASRARDQGREVASTAREQTERVTSVAREQGLEVVQSAAGQAAEVVASAREQATQVAQEASAQARGLLEETRSRLEEQATTGAEKLGENLRRVGDEAQALADGRPEDAPLVRDYVQRAGDVLLEASERAYGVADDLQERGLAGVLQDVQRFARRRPGAFLLGTAFAGIAVGRAVRAASAPDGPTEQQEELERPRAAAISTGSPRRTRTAGGR